MTLLVVAVVVVVVVVVVVLFYLHDFVFFFLCGAGSQARHSAGQGNGHRGAAGARA